MKLKLTLQKLISATIRRTAAPGCRRVVPRLLSVILRQGILVFKLMAFIWNVIKAENMEEQSELICLVMLASGIPVQLNRKVQCCSLLFKRLLRFFVQFFKMQNAILNRRLLSTTRLYTELWSNLLRSISEKPPLSQPHDTKGGQSQGLLHS